MIIKAEEILIGLAAIKSNGNVIMWETEEKAMRRLKSDWKQQMSVTNDKNSTLYESILNNLAKEIKGKRRIKPIPPSLRRIPASSMEPKVGASTCAIGSQKCRP